MATDGDLLKRIVTSIAVLLVAAAVTYLLPIWVFCALTVVFISFSMHEFLSIVEKKGYFVYKYFGVGFGIAIPIVIYLHYGQGYANLEAFFIVIACPGVMDRML